MSVKFRNWVSKLDIDERDDVKKSLLNSIRVYKEVTKDELNGDRWDGYTKNDYYEEVYEELFKDLIKIEILEILKWKNGDDSDDRYSGLFALGLEVAESDKQLELHEASLFSGRMCGKRITSRMERELVNSIVSRSMPMPSPAVGGMP